MPDIDPGEVRALLARMEWTQKQLAERLGVDDSRLSRLLHRSKSDQELLARALKLLRSGK